MRVLEWNDSYSVGVKSLDIQHQKLLLHLNSLFAMFNGQIQKEQIDALLIELEQYAKVHFTEEEELFNKYKFYGSDAHHQEHRMYEEKIREFRGKFDASNEKVNIEILEFLADWLMGHIQGTDKDYTKFMHNNGVF